MTTDTTPATAPITHPIPPDVPPRVERDEDGRYWLRGRFGGILIDGPEPTSKDLEALEEHDYPLGRDIFFVPVVIEGEIWHLDLPVCCDDLAKRTGTSNEAMAQHFVDIAFRKTTALLPMCSDLAARRLQISIIADMVGWSRGFGTGQGFCSLDAVNEHRDGEFARGFPGITDAMVRWHLDKGPRQCPWPDDPRRDEWFFGEDDDDEADREINMAIWERVRDAAHAWDWKAAV
jgi:hypothetical protein